MAGSSDFRAQVRQEVTRRLTAPEHGCTTPPPIRSRSIESMLEADTLSLGHEENAAVDVDSPFELDRDWLAGAHLEPDHPFAFTTQEAAASTQEVEKKPAATEVAQPAVRPLEGDGRAAVEPLQDGEKKPEEAPQPEEIEETKQIRTKKDKQQKPSETGGQGLGMTKVTDVPDTFEASEEELEKTEPPPKEPKTRAKGRAKAVLKRPAAIMSKPGSEELPETAPGDADTSKRSQQMKRPAAASAVEAKSLKQLKRPAAAAKSSKAAPEGAGDADANGGLSKEQNSDNAGATSHIDMSQWVWSDPDEHGGRESIHGHWKAWIPFTFFTFSIDHHLTLFLLSFIFSQF